MQDAKDGRKEVQRRTFTRWMNVYLSRHDPPAEVCDLFRDMQDGRILMTLLEELTGCKLLYRYRSSSHRIFRLNNISKALAFLDDRHVRLLGIDASAVADGVPSVVLNLIWNIILYFQVKEMTGGLHRRLSSSLSSLSTGAELTDEPAPNPIRNTAKRTKYNGKTIKSLLHWVKRCTVKFGVEVHDFGRSWGNGLAFLALIKSINPVLVDLKQSLTKDPGENLEQAFKTAHQHLDIPPLLEPQDVSCSCPDEKSVITYVSMFLRHCPDKGEDLSSALSSPHISKFRSLETLADREEAPPVFSSLETSHELLLWKRWARRSSNSAPKNKRRSSGALQPPSPLDADVANPDIRSWLTESSDHGYSKTENDEINFSFTSEEGIYSLTPLDSDEEDAYSYILDLNEDAARSQAKRRVPRVEEETEEISLINGESELHAHYEDLNGHCKEKSTNTEQDRIERMTQVDAGHPEKPVDNLHCNDKAGNQLQAPNDLKGPKTSEKRDSFIENLTEDIMKANENNEIQKLRLRKKVVGEAGPSIESKEGRVSVSVTKIQDIANDRPLLSSKTHREASGEKYKHGTSSITARNRAVPVQSVAPSAGLNSTELYVMLVLWMLLYCYFIGQHIISY